MTQETAYLEQRHAQWAVSKNVLSGLVRRSTGQDACAFDRVVAGHNNEVYFVQTNQADTYVVRITRSGESGAAEEQWCLQRCAEVGVPVPHVMAVESVDAEGEQMEAMVLTKLDGSPLSEMRDTLAPPRQASAWEQMGSVLSKIHTIRAGGFYKRGPEDNWDFPDWPTISKATCEGRSAERPFLRQAGFDEQDIDFMLGIVRYYGEQFNCPTPVLCHGDFLPEHVFFDECLNVTGVIDFGLYQGNHPIHDFAIVSMEYGLDGVHLLRRGYGHSWALDDCFDLRLHLHLVPLEIGWLAHVVKTSNPSAQRHVHGLRRTIAWLREHGIA